MTRPAAKRPSLALLLVACAGAFACDKAESPGGTGGSAGTTSGPGGTSSASGGSGTGGGSGSSASGGTANAGGSTSGTAGVTSNGSAGTSTSGSGGASGSGGSAGTSTTGGSAGTTGGSAGDASGASGGSAGTSDGGTSGTGGSGSVFPSSVTRPKIMIVGDSISAGPGCYKKYLVQNLTNDGITNYDFVGQYTDDCGGGVRHSAVSCTTSANYTQATFTVPNCTNTTYPGMATLVQTHNPDLVMLQLGVNDVWGGTAAVQSILNNYTTLVTQARAHNPNVVVMVAQIHKIITDNCTNAASTTKAQELVMAIPAWAAGVSTAESPVLVADLWTNSDAHEAEDCVHPNDAGARRMGLNWFNALKPILR